MWMDKEREDEVGETWEFEREQQVKKHAAHVFTEVNASLTLSVSGQTSESSYLFCYMIPDYKFHEINSDV